MLGEGVYVLSVVYNCIGGYGFSLLYDGIGFVGNLCFGYVKFSVVEVWIVVYGGIILMMVIMNYCSGLFLFVLIKCWG